MLQNQSLSAASQLMHQTAMHTSKRILDYLVTGKQDRSENEADEVLRGFEILMRIL